MSVAARGLSLACAAVVAGALAGCPEAATSTCGAGKRQSECDAEAAKKKQAPKLTVDPPFGLGFECTTSLDTMLDEVIPWVTDAVASGRL